MTRLLTTAFVSLVLFATSVAAQTAATPERPLLKSEAVVTGGIVRIGDLVEHAGIVANVPIFRAPDLGSTGSVPVDAVLEAVRAHALIGLDTGGLGEVVVIRASRTIPAKDVEDIIAAALSKQYGLGAAQNVAVNFERELRAIHVEPSAKGALRLGRINFEARTGRFDATLEIPTSAANRGMLRLSGRAAATVEVVTLLRPVDRGALIKTADVAIERRPRAEIGRDIISASEQAIGFAARTALQPGRPLRVADLMKPELVQRNETVTLVYEVPGIMLTVRGKASEGGSEGDVVSVLNEQSKRTVQGVVVGPGRVVVGTGSPRLAANLAASQSATDEPAR